MGKWTRGDGATVEIPCPNEFGDVTILAEGCILRLRGGGLVYTKEADATVFSEFEMASKMIDGLKLEVGTLRSDMEELKKTHLLQISALSQSAQKDIDELQKAHRLQSLRNSITTAAIGAVVGALLLALAL